MKRRWWPVLLKCVLFRKVAGNVAHLTHKECNLHSNNLPSACWVNYKTQLQILKDWLWTGFYVLNISTSWYRDVTSYKKNRYPVSSQAWQVKEHYLTLGGRNLYLYSSNVMWKKDYLTYHHACLYMGHRF